jgi:hypothetical protein
MRIDGSFGRAWPQHGIIKCGREGTGNVAIDTQRAGRGFGGREKAPKPVVADERARARPQVHVVFAEANVGFALQA